MENQEKTQDIPDKPKKSAQHIRRLINLLRDIILLAVVVGGIYYGKDIFVKKKPVAEIPPKPVQIGVAIEQDAPMYIESFGSLTPPNNVNIQAQVTGEVKEIHFIEGQDVKEGELLFLIDPAPYKATLDKARASLKEDLAQLKLAKLTFERNRKLFDRKLISDQDFDKYATDLAAAEAKIKLDNAEIELAKINLDYCYIKSPVDGRTGKRQVDLGNIVTANSGPTLVNIKTIDTLYVDFTIPETSLNDVRDSLKEKRLKAEVYFDDNEEKTYPGSIELLDNTVDNTTGTVLLRALIENKDRKLWAGQFVRVRLILGEYKDAVLVPYEAIQYGQKGSYVFVVTPDNKAELRLVKTGCRQKDYIVVLEGVKVGERVVTSGQLGLSEGVKVADVAQMKE